MKKSLPLSNATRLWYDLRFASHRLEVVEMTPFEFVTKLHIPVTHPFALRGNLGFILCPRRPTWSPPSGSHIAPLNIASAPLSSSPYSKVPFEVMTCL